jgi:prolyl-tRNA synthetase
VGRLAASICEAKHDEYGPIWPISIAPWEIEVCCLRVDDEQTKSVSDEIYDKFQKAGLDVIYDDRDVRPGAMFSDADLIGAPIRVVVSPRNLKDSLVEITTRDKSIKEMVPVEETFETVRKLRESLFEALNQSNE